MAAAVEARRPAVGAAMPIKTLKLELDEIGYPGWYITLRTNPRSSVYDQLISAGEDEPTNADKAERQQWVEREAKRWWASFSQVVIEWNFADEHGMALPPAKDFESEKGIDLPLGLLPYVCSQWFEAVRLAAQVPKGRSDNSAPTSSTSDESPPNGKA